MAQNSLLRIWCVTESKRNRVAPVCKPVAMANPTALATYSACRGEASCWDSRAKSTYQYTPTDFDVLHTNGKSRGYI